MEPRNNWTDEQNIPEIKVTVRDGEVFNQMGITFEVIEVPWTYS